MKETIESQIILGDAKEISEKLPFNFFQAIITSPPYFGHRKYTEDSDKREIGRENNDEEYIDKMVGVFKLLKNNLKENGLLWLNLGDTYRNKQLLGIPWRVALALQKDGWILRSDIIWYKPNAMPSSIKDRPTTDHEYVFMFSKSQEYFYNSDAIREPHKTFSEESKMKGGRNHFGKVNGTPEKGKNSGNTNLHHGRWDQAFHPKGRNKRTVWEIPLSKFKDSHFAVYPEKLVETCLLASTSENDFVLDPFSGSGTTAIVACKNNRRFIGIELEKKYQQMSQKRIRDFLAKYPLFNKV